MKNSLRFLLPLVALSGVIAFAYAQNPGTEKKAKKRVLVCTVTTGFRHSSIPFAEKTLEKLGLDSGSYEIVEWSKQPDAADKEQKEAQLKASMDKLSPANLEAKKIDAVIFANTTGDLPLPDKEGFIKWIENGHAFCAMHSGSDTFHGYKGYLDMLQGEFQTHGAQVPADLIRDDASHPATAGLPEQWDLKMEEMYVIKSHDRSKVRSLLHLRHHPNNKDDAKYYAVSWCREFGKGKVFYTSLGHREDLWSDDPALRDRKNSVETSKQVQKHILGGIEWALGLKPGSAQPNPDVN